MATKTRTSPTRPTRARRRAPSALTRAQRSIAERVSHLSRAQVTTALIIAGGVIGGAALLIARPKLVRRVVGGGAWLAATPFGPKLFTVAYERARDGLAGLKPALAKATPSALLG